MKQIENDYVKFWIKDEILYSKFKKPCSFDLKMVKETIALRHEISENQNQYWCYDLHNLKSFPKEARDYAAKYGQEYLYASGAIVESKVTRFLLNFFNTVNKPHVPFVAFKSEELAVIWLKKMKIINAHNTAG